MYTGIATMELQCFSCIAGKNSDNIMGLAQQAEFLLAVTERMAVENQSEEGYGY